MITQKTSDEMLQMLQKLYAALVFNGEKISQAELFKLITQATIEQQRNTGRIVCENGMVSK